MVCKDYSQIPESDLIVNYITERYKKGLGTNILTTGLSGTGKSSCDLRLAELISMKLHGENRITEKNIVDSLLGLLEVLNNNKGDGTIIIIEEVSVLFPSRRAMAKENVSVNRVLDTIRKRKMILISNAPLYPSIDSHIRSMGHVLLETLKVNKTKQVVIFKGWRLQTNPHTGKTYRHRFLRKGRDVMFHYTHKPDKSVWDEYEMRKDSFMKDLYMRLKKQTIKKQEKEDKELGINKGNGKNPKELTPLEMSRLNKYNSGLKLREIAKEEGIGLQSIAKGIRNAKKKLNIL